MEEIKNKQIYAGDNIGFYKHADLVAFIKKQKGVIKGISGCNQSKGEFTETFYFSNQDVRLYVATSPVNTYPPTNIRVTLEGLEEKLEEVNSIISNGRTEYETRVISDVNKALFPGQEPGNSPKE